MEKLLIYSYFFFALVGLLIHWAYDGKKMADRPSAVRYVQVRWAYVLTSAGLTLVACLFFMPKVLGADANAAALAFGMSGGFIMRAILTPKA